jgi:beta-lactamase regulating signal transducer with metallopeptidase domain
MIAIKFLDSLAAPWITALLNGIWQASLVTAAVGIALRFGKRLNASTRYAIWWVTLAATMAICAVNFGALLIPRAADAQPRIVMNAPPAPQQITSPVASLELRPSTETAIAAPAPVTRTTRPAPLEIRLESFPLALGGLWIAGALLMLIRLGGGLFKLMRLRVRSAAAPQTHVHRIRALICHCGVKRRVGLGTSPDLRTPVAAGLYRPTVLIPSALLRHLSAAEFDQIAVHELAHIRRWDDWGNLIQRLIDAIFVFHPAVRFISRQLDLEREIACDDFVLDQMGRPRDYAVCLTRLVEMTGWARQSALAPGATIYRSHLAARVEKLLDRTRNAHPGIARRVVVALGVVLVLLVLTSSRVPALWAFARETEDFAAPPLHLHLPPVLMAMAGGKGGQSYTSYSSSTNDHYTQVRWVQNGRGFEMDLQGEVEFAEDDHDVKTLSPGGRFRMSEEGSPDRRYEVRADGSGHLSRTYFESGRAVPLDDEGRRWLASRLPEMIRETGAGAAKRVQRILHQNGPDAVSAEIGLIRSDGSKRLYLQEFLLHGNLDEAHLRSGMRLTRGVSSDGEKRMLLTSVAPLYLRDGLRPDLFDAINTISSDGEHARILSDLVKDDPSNRETLLLTARSAGRISSDGERARVLIEVSDHYRGNEEMRGAWFATLDGISSDGEKRRALSAIIARDGKDRDTLAEALKSAVGISSDGERAQLLVESSGYYLEDPAIRRSFFAAVDGISSDGEKHRALAALYQQSSRNPATVKMIIRSAKGISSDGEKASMLADVAGPLVSDPALMDDFFSACDSISSDGEHARVLLRVVNNGHPGPAALVKTIESATRISSDGEKAKVLAEVIRLHSSDAGVQAALRRSLSSVSSDGEYRRLSLALNN